MRQLSLRCGGGTSSALDLALWTSFFQRPGNDRLGRVEFPGRSVMLSLFHHTPECEEPKMGLNFSRCRGGFRIFWQWYTREEGGHYYFRFRFHIWPFFIFDKSKGNNFKAIAFERNLVVITREEYADLKASSRLDKESTLWLSQNKSLQGNKPESTLTSQNFNRK